LMLRRSTRQYGFTLIEVSLAIVIGVIILAGGISLYNQTKLSAGNSKASEKVLSLVTLADEMMASNPAQAYPSSSQLSNMWAQRRPDDAWASPWGGASGVTAIQLPSTNQTTYTAATEPWTSTALSAGVNTGYGATQAAALTAAATISSDPYATCNIKGLTDRVGQILYNRGPNWVNVYDAVDFTNHQFKNFFVGMVNSQGNGLAFTAGGK